MKIFIRIIIVALALVSLIFLFDRYCIRYPEYVLYKKGISKSDILLTKNKDNFNIYLYKKDKNNIGLINLFKETSQSKEWKTYTNQIENINKSVILTTYYSFVVNGKPEVASIIAGSTITKNSKDIKIRIDDKLVIPTITKNEDNGIIYFFIDLGYFQGSKNIEIIESP